METPRFHFAPGFVGLVPQVKALGADGVGGREASSFISPRVFLGGRRRNPEDQ